MSRSLKRHHLAASVALAAALGVAAAYRYFPVQVAQPSAARPSLNEGLPVVPHKSVVVRTVQGKRPERPPASTQRSAPDDPAFLEAGALFELMSAGLTAQACADASSGLLDLLVRLHDSHPIWAWSMQQVRGCFGQLGFEAQRAIVEGLQAAKPSNPKVLELAAAQDLYSGRLEDAISKLERALQVVETNSALENLGVAKFFQATGVFGTAAEGDRRSALLVEARTAISRAAELTKPGVSPWQLQTMSLIELASGNEKEALRWADQMISATRLGGDEWDANQAASLYVGAGTIYYRAGQPDTGVAYMDEGIRMATTPERRAELEQQKASTISAEPQPG